MAYEKNTWATGDVVTANKLNHIEDGIINNGIFIVNITVSEITDTTGTKDKSLSEISAAFNAGMRCYANILDTLVPLINASASSAEFSGLVLSPDDSNLYAVYIICTNSVRVFHSTDPLIETGL